MVAYNERQEINQHLTNLEDATPETKGKLLQLLESIKDGSLGGVKLGKETGEMLVWLAEKAVVVSGLLVGMSF